MEQERDLTFNEAVDVWIENLVVEQEQIKHTLVIQQETLDNQMIILDKMVQLLRKFADKIVKGEKRC